MKFSVINSEFKFSGYYYIVLGDDESPSRFFCDFDIAKKLKISLDQYFEELKQFYAFEYEGLFWFKSKKHVEQAVNYLNDKYIVLFKLLGD